MSRCTFFDPRLLMPASWHTSPRRVHRLQRWLVALRSQRTLLRRQAVQAHEAREAGRVKATVEAPIKLAVSAEEMEKINATKVEVLALTNALDACVNIAGRVCFLGLKDAFTFNAAVEMTFAHEAIDVEEHEADHEAIVELIDAALASLDAKPAGAMKAIKSALVAHYVAFDRFEAVVSV
mmetsp:Transcript_1452/g.4884  ORF Transcript_1452/g.4884 Transcript_1452/m.4884 type:complete len:180 (+) Transcript_1452:1256-1795(+)